MSKALMCPKCGRKFKSHRGMPGHVGSCEGKAVARAKPARRAKRRTTTKTAPASDRVRTEGMAVVLRLQAVEAEFRKKADDLVNVGIELRLKANQLREMAAELAKV